MIGLAGLGAAAGLAGGPWLAAFAARYAVGAALAARGVWARGGRSRATGALVYEPLAIAVALCVAARLARSRTIEWGGARYER